MTLLRLQIFTPMLVVTISAFAAAIEPRDEPGRERPDPKDFDTAFDRGREMVGRLQEIRAAVQLAETNDQRQQATRELELLESEAGRMFQLALKLREPDSDRSAVAQARYLLSYVFLQQRKSFDAFVLARHVMRHHRNDAAETAADATEMAISAAVQIWAAAPNDDRGFELNLVREICEEIIGAFPASRRSTVARMRLGRIYLDLDQPQKAAEIFLQVAQDDAGYAAARIEAGQAWWLAWAQASSGRSVHRQEPTNAATLIDWKQRARSLLTEGIQLSRDAQTDNGLSDDIVRAEVSLCGLLNQDGDFTETVRRLAQGSPTVLSAIESSDGRPLVGVRGAAFAGLCYRTVLRAYVGTQQIDEALAIMQKLQSLGATNTTTIYTQLGRELQLELTRLQSSGQVDRLQQVRTSFDQFLEQIYLSRDPSNSGALLWIGETYASLARGTDDPVAAKSSFTKAATIYQELLKSELDEPTETAVKFWLIRIYRQQKNFESAVELGTEILSKNSGSVSIQMEIAHVLADWGENGTPERLLDSIRGTPADGKDQPIWGWAALARRLQNSKRSDNWEELKPLFLEARFELSRSRLRYARTNPQAGQKQLEVAARELTSMAQVFNEFNDEWWSRFDGLYQEVQTQLGRPGLALARPDGTAAPSPNNARASPVGGDPLTDLGESDIAISPGGGRKKQTREGRPNSLHLVLGISLMAATAGAISFVIMRRPKKKPRNTYVGESGTTVRTQNPPRHSDGSPPIRRGRPKSLATGTSTGERTKRPANKPVSQFDSGETPKPRKKKRRQPPQDK